MPILFEPYKVLALARAEEQYFIEVIDLLFHYFANDAPQLGLAKQKLNPCQKKLNHLIDQYKQLTEDDELPITFFFNAEEYEKKKQKKVEDICYSANQIRDVMSIYFSGLCHSLKNLFCMIDFSKKFKAKIEEGIDLADHYKCLAKAIRSREIDIINFDEDDKTATAAINQIREYKKNYSHKVTAKTISNLINVLSYHLPNHFTFTKNQWQLLFQTKAKTNKYKFYQLTFPDLINAYKKSLALSTATLLKTINTFEMPVLTSGITYLQTQNELMNECLRLKNNENLPNDKEKEEKIAPRLPQNKLAKIRNSYRLNGLYGSNANDTMETIRESSYGKRR